MLRYILWILKSNPMMERGRIEWPYKRLRCEEGRREEKGIDTLKQNEKCSRSIDFICWSQVANEATRSVAFRQLFVFNNHPTTNLFSCWLRNHRFGILHEIFLNSFNFFLRFCCIHSVCSFLFAFRFLLLSSSFRLFEIRWEYRRFFEAISNYIGFEERCQVSFIQNYSGV